MKRLQVLMDESELRDIQRLAKRKKMTVAEWVRQSLRSARNEEPRIDSRKKLEAIREAMKHSFPAPGIDQMLDEIESGYLADDES